MNIQTLLRGKEYRFETKPGLFSKSEIDDGTKLLIDTMEIKPTSTVLDLGCGYGAIGIVASDLATEGRVYMVDTDIRAVRYSRINAKINNVKNTLIKPSDGFEELEGILFDAVLSNPPSHLPKETLLEFIEDAKKQLTSEGKIYFVTEKRIRPLIQREFERVFGNYDAIASKAQYVVSFAMQE